MASRRIENLVKSVNNRLQPLLEFDRFYAALYDPIRSLIEFPWVVQDGLPVEWNTRPYEPAPRLLDSLIQTGSSQLQESDFELELNTIRLENWPEGGLPKSWLAVPLIVGDRAIGAIVVENRRKPKAFGENGLRVLTSVARQAAVAIENARLVDQRERKIASLRALYEMGQKLNSEIRLDEPEILKIIFGQASDLMDTSNLYIALYDQATDTVSFPLMFVDGQPAQVVSRSGGTGRTEWIIRNRQPIFIETRDESVQWYKEHEGTEYIGEPFASWIGVALMAGDKVLGVIATYHKTQDFVYTKDDQEILSLMANQAAVAIENARLYSNLEERTQQLQKRNEQLAALQKIGVEITSQRELGEVLGSIAEHANIIMSADFSTIFPYDSVQNIFGMGVRKGKIEIEPTVPSGTGYSARLANSREAVFAETVESSGVKPVFIENKKVRSFTGVALVFRGETVGVLYVNYLERHSFSKEERDVIGLLASQAAVAIENARLYDDMEKRVAERTQAWWDAQQEAAVAERKRLEAEKWAELGKTAGSLAHRIGNKGGIVRVCVSDVKDRLREKGIEDPALDEKINTIERSNEYLLEMSDLLFKPVQAGSAEITKMSIPLLLADAIKSAEIPEDVLVEVQEGIGQLPPLPANRSFVEVFAEIIINALTAMESSPEKILIIDGQVVNDCAEISFTDTGTGIPADNMERLFDLFTQLSEKPIGLGRRGFGLWWVRSFLSSVGGEIWGESILNKGSIFTIKLPL